MGLLCLLYWVLGTLCWTDISPHFWHKPNRLLLKQAGLISEDGSASLLEMHAVVDNRKRLTVCWVLQMRRTWASCTSSAGWSWWRGC